MSVFTNPAGGTPEQAADYVGALRGLLGDAEPLDVLRRTPGALEEAVDGLDEDALSRPEAPGKWSVRQVVRHLADSELVWAWRLRLVLAQDRPPITGYDQDLWADRLAYGDADVGQALTEFAAVRAGNLRLLEGAGEADLARAGVHAERGEESVAHMLTLYAGHDLLHLAQIGRIVAAGA